MILFGSHSRFRFGGLGFVPHFALAFCATAAPHAIGADVMPVFVVYCLSAPKTRTAIYVAHR